MEGNPLEEFEKMNQQYSSAFEVVRSPLKFKGKGKGAGRFDWIKIQLHFNQVGYYGEFSDRNAKRVARLATILEENPKQFEALDKRMDELLDKAMEQGLL